jgi:hypothetical protein
VPWSVCKNPAAIKANSHFRTLIKEYDPTLYDEDVKECELAGEFENGASYVCMKWSK